MPLGGERSKALAILSCPGCGHRLRVPDNKRGTVTCPLCGSEWFHPEVIELSSVEFRCSASGAKFNVIGSRRSPLHKFTVQKIEKAIPKATDPLEAGSPYSSPQLGPRNALPALPPAATGVVGWLARIVGRKTDVVPSKPISEVPNAQRTTAAISATTNDADEYNWSGFFCPYCNAAGFVSCGGGHLACDGTIQVRKDGRFHQCFCGRAGFISGMIKTYKNERLSVETEVDRSNAPPAVRPQQSSKPADVALPTPAQRLPAKR
jgi:transcription elongation factor Elf1